LRYSWIEFSAFLNISTLFLFLPSKTLGHGQKEDYEPNCHEDKGGEEGRSIKQRNFSIITK
jgi:hypothetical protein